MKETILALLLMAVLPVFAFAGKMPTAESKGAFLKIVDAERPLGAPVDRDAPDVLYIRKSSIVRVSVIYATQNSEYRVIVVTNGPATAARFDDDKLTLASDAKVYFYAFPNQASASAFCDLLTLDPKE